MHELLQHVILKVKGITFTLVKFSFSKEASSFNTMNSFCDYSTVANKVTVVVAVLSELEALKMAHRMTNPW